MKLEKIDAKGERYAYDDKYILEVWQVEDINKGRKFEFYLTSTESIYKMYMYGAPQYHPFTQKSYTKSEMIKMALGNVSDYIKAYEEESKAIEAALNDILMRK
jgi:hypothetical protein